jgi:hypothetical protein
MKTNKLNAMQNKIKLTFVLFVAILVNSEIKAQQGNTFYYMNKVSQSTYFNPSLIPEYDFTISGLALPIIGQLPPTMYFNYANNGFQYSDIIHHGTGLHADSLVIDPDLFLKNLRTSNHLRFQNHFDLLHLGFKTSNDDYITITITEKLDYGLTLPKDLFELAWYGNNHFRENNEHIVFTNLNAHFSHYREIAGGYSTQVMDNLTVGGRVKILFGMSNVKTDIDELTLFTDQDDYGITAVADMGIQSSVPVEWEFDRDSMELSANMDNFNPLEYAFSFKNPGFAIDLGASYEINSDFTAYYSVNDLGFISWAGNPFNISTDGTFTFRGIELDVFAEEEEREGQMEAFADSILEIFRPIDDNNSYITWLPTDMYLGGQYHFHDMLDFGALYRLEFYQKHVLQSLTLSANSNLTPWISAHLSYSIMNNSANNLGFGLMIRGAALQWYFVSDNVLGAIFPQNTRNINLRMGCNLVFGYKKLKSESLL